MKAFLLALVTLVFGFVIGLWWRHPEAVLRPTPSPSAKAEEKGEPGRVTLTAEQVRNAAIEVSPVPQRDAKEVVDVGGIIESDPSRTSKIAARAAGRVVTLAAAVGQRVEAGQIVAVIDSPEIADRRARVRSAAARVEVAERRLARERRLAAAGTQNVGPLAEARLRRERARAEADRTAKAWQRAQKLYPEIMSRSDYDVVHADAQRAAAEMRTAEQALAVEERAARGGVRVRTETESAVTELEAAQADLRAARESLDALGVGDGPRGEFAVTSPLSALVSTRPTNVGEWIEASGTLYTVVDMSRVWAQVDIYERDLHRVKVGDDVTITSGAYPERTFQGRLSFIHPLLEEHARTARGRVELVNGAGLLRGGMFVKARIMVARRANAPTVPHDAVLAEGEQSYVYVEEAKGRFVRRDIVLGSSDGESYEVRQGLRPGERIVTRGAFYIKSEQQREQIGGEE